MTGGMREGDEVADQPGAYDHDLHDDPDFSAYAFNQPDPVEAPIGQAQAEQPPSKSSPTGKRRLDPTDPKLTPQQRAGLRYRARQAAPPDQPLDPAIAPRPTGRPKSDPARQGRVGRSAPRVRLDPDDENLTAMQRVGLRHRQRQKAIRAGDAPDESCALRSPGRPRGSTRRSGRQGPGTGQTGPSRPTDEVTVAQVAAMSLRDGPSDTRGAGGPTTPASPSPGSGRETSPTYRGRA